MAATPHDTPVSQSEPVAIRHASRIELIRAQAASRLRRTPTPVTGDLFAPPEQPRHPAPPALSQPHPKSQTKPTTPVASLPEAFGQREIRGKIVRILFNDAESGKAMFLIKDRQGATLKVQGFSAMTAVEGRHIVAQATLESHPKFGEQYRADVIDEDIPLDRTGAIAYMSRTLEGVGAALAGRIFDALGADTYDVISSNPQKLLSIPGIGESKLQDIKESWAEHSVIRTLWSHLAKHKGIGGSVAGKIFAKFGNRSMDLVRHYPYELAKINGIGFKTADLIAIDSGIAKDSPARITGAVHHILENLGQQGHTSRLLESMIDDVAKLTGIEIEIEIKGQCGNVDERGKIRNVIQELVRRKEMSRRQLDSGLCLASTSAVAAERNIAKRIRELSESGGVSQALSELAGRQAKELGDTEQTQAVVNAFLNPISVITGRPGCGKTTVTKVLVEVAKLADLKIVMCAPTGKASRRTTEATGHESSTVHSLIGMRPNNEGLMTIEYTQENPLSGDLFVLDEASMMDTFIMSSFLSAVPNGARIVFVGDADQLPSVGPGNVLHNLIDSGNVAVTQLKTIHRNALNSDIVLNAHHIIGGNGAKMDLGGQGDFQFTSAIEDEKIVEVAVEQYLALVDKHGIENVQVLAARRDTATGIYALNAALRRVINPEAPGKPVLEHFGQVLRLGDRVMRTSNNRRMGVSNGEVGIIKHIDTEAKSVLVNFGDRDILHDRKELSALELAYAITAHKSQGSEYAGVVLVAPRAHKFMLNRNLLYTAITRGKRDVRLVGAEDAVRGAASRPGNKRCTGLVSEMQAAFSVGANAQNRAPGTTEAKLPTATTPSDSAADIGASIIQKARMSAPHRRPT